MFGILPLVVLYPLSFGVSLDLLKDGFICPTTFLISSTIPYCTLLLTVKKKFVGLQRRNLSEEEQICVDEILRLEGELFKEENSSVFRWPVVQLYRILLITVLNIFVINPIYRSVSFLPLFLIFSLHDRSSMPYKHSYLNYLQILSSACLLVITACNVTASFSTAFDLLVVPGMKDIMIVLKYTEFASLVAVPSSLIVWQIREKYKSRYGNTKSDKNK